MLKDIQGKNMKESLCNNKEKMIIDFFLSRIRQFLRIVLYYKNYYTNFLSTHAKSDLYT